MQTPYFDDRSQGYECLKRNQANLEVACNEWFSNAVSAGYMYQWNWMGIPFIQFPQDVMVLQQIIMREQPTVIVETGIARGGSSAFFASMLHLAHLGTNNEFKVISVDIEIREHTHKALDKFVLRPNISLIEGSSIEINTLNKVKELLNEDDKVMVFLDSNHTHSHVLKELELYSALVTKGQYMVVMDTVIEYLESDVPSSRPWCKGNSPLSAVREFLDGSDFTIDEFSEIISGPTCAPHGFLRRSLS